MCSSISAVSIVTVCLLTVVVVTQVVQIQRSQKFCIFFRQCTITVQIKIYIRLNHEEQIIRRQKQR